MLRLNSLSLLLGRKFPGEMVWIRRSALRKVIHTDCANFKSPFNPSIFMRQNYLLAALIPVALTACVSNSPEKSAASIPYKIERWQKDVDLPKSVRLIRFENLHGNVVLKNSPDALVGIAATEQRLGDKPEVAELVVEIQGEVANFKIIYASDATKGADAKVDGHLKGRVDLAVFVPDRMPLEVSTSFGSLAGRKLHNPVTANTGSGNLSIASTLRSHLKSETGRVIFLPSDCDAASGSTVETRGTDALVDVPTYCNLLVRVQAKSLLVGQLPGVLSDGRWQKRYPEKDGNSAGVAPELQIDSPNAALTLTLMTQKNLF